jgi:hypothetical protein
LTLIRLLREGLPRSLQANWPLFCHKVALPLRNELSSESPRGVVPGTDEIVLTRWHFDRWALLIAVGVLGMVVCLHFSSQILSMEPKMVIGAIWLTILPLEAVLIAFRFSIPVKGRIQKVMRWTSRERQALLWLFAGILFYLAVRFFGSARPPMRVTSGFLGVACICVCLALAMAPGFRRRREKDRQQKSVEPRSVAEESARRWNELDPVAPPLEKEPLRP